MSQTIATEPAAAALHALVAKYDGRAPRYTSYPTAVQFTPAVNADTYRTWLAKLDPAEAISLYLHIPFCTRLCWYCGCSTRVVNQHGPIRDYVHYLLRELALLEDALPSRLPVEAIHFGGGTPNTLAIDEVDAIFAAIARVFARRDDVEIAAELDPSALSREWVRAAAKHGLNRASLGVQTLDRTVQQAVNRNESYEDIAACVGWLRDAGVASVNLDLMYGLPHQTTRNMLQTVESILALRPERIALFGYAHVPWMKAHQKLIDENALPGPDERLDQSEQAAARLMREGYVRIGLDHFALPNDDLAIASSVGALRRNFQGYTTDEAPTLLGVGASAISATREGFAQNDAQEIAWRAAIDRDRLPIVRGVARTPEDAFRGEIIERLMCDLTVDLAAVCSRHGRAVHSLANELERLRAFEADGLLTLDHARVTLSPAGRLLMRSVCTVFDAYLDPEAGRHSKAI
jgi:oxygen-independent coproporphyrinogen-3 oxidase